MYFVGTNFHIILLRSIDALNYRNHVLIGNRLKLYSNDWVDEVAAAECRADEEKSRLQNSKFIFEPIVDGGKNESLLLR